MDNFLLFVSFPHLQIWSRIFASEEWPRERNPRQSLVLISSRSNKINERRRSSNEEWSRRRRRRERREFHSVLIRSMFSPSRGKMSEDAKSEENACCPSLSIKTIRCGLSVHIVVRRHCVTVALWRTRSHSRSRSNVWTVFFIRTQWKLFTGAIELCHGWERDLPKEIIEHLAHPFAVTKWISQRGSRRNGRWYRRVHWPDNFFFSFPRIHCQINHSKGRSEGRKFFERNLLQCLCHWWRTSARRSHSFRRLNGPLISWQEVYFLGNTNEFNSRSRRWTSATHRITLWRRSSSDISPLSFVFSFFFGAALLFIQQL